MKAIFPCKGTVVLTKRNVDTLHNIYTDNMVNSKLFAIYNQSNYSVQVGTFNYLPKKSTIVTEKTTFLSIQQLHKILSEHMANMPVAKEEEEPEVEEDNEPLDDNFVLNHPFFETLKPID